MPPFGSTEDNPCRFFIPSHDISFTFGSVIKEKYSPLLFPFAFLRTLLAACTSACLCPGQPHTSALWPGAGEAHQVPSLSLETCPGCTLLQFSPFLN